jgi:hypothetical protein
VNWCKYICFFFLPAFCFEIAAQSLQGLQENQVIKHYLVDHPNSLKSASSITSLTLPFFEDFSTSSSVFPDPAKWADNYAFINSSFAVDPISIGVATLDAIDENGNVYALTDWPTSSDKLTTQGFDLSSYHSPGDTVRLSFFYQCGGNGETPERNDSLLLEYYYPPTNKWTVAWYSIMNTSSGFQQVILEVPGTYYLNGFRFRFRNYTSISANDVTGGMGAVGNADCWNLDYIMMNTNPVSTHRSINDITLIDYPKKLLDFYEIIPWLHLNAAQSITRNSLNFALRNLHQGEVVNVGRSYYLKDLQTGYLEAYEEYFELISPDTLIRRSDPFFAPFTRNNDSEEGMLEVGSYLVTPAGQYKQNDTSKIVLNFKDAYAYDDGTPEYGFGISGPSMTGALLASRFRIYESDTLRALDMLFNKSRNNFNATLGFNLCVWKDENGKPGELIFMSPEEYTPGSGLTMPGGFKRYAINANEDLIITDTVIFVGWKQVTDEFLNLGYDVNRNNLNRTYINTMGDWDVPGNSIIPGSIMIRAVFGNRKVLTGTNEIPIITQPDVKLYPNPVSGILNIEPNGTVINCISILDITGRLVLQQEKGHNQVDVTGLPPGIYQVQLTTDKNLHINRKIIVSH